MASKECMVISLLVVALISVIVVGMILSEKDEKVPCYFVFGDSLSDNGNNNNLETSIKANFSPYGHDFPNGPTGRFTNGKTMHDFLAEHFGIHDYIPPFAIAKDNESVNVTQGVNYASGWAGIRDESGQRLGVRIPLNEQLRNHKIIVSRISKKMGDSAAKKHLSECIYALQIGGNDYTDNFFQPEHYNTSHQYTQEHHVTGQPICRIGTDTITPKLGIDTLP
ncbi:Lipase, GDSL [Corchorus olitorius]|uniref:Lipase, GDSL n=1 Tax=Corchorus olitorius TaxID=93759 RepID=A0A1R3H5H1_9ROSI|nr:Lipase, GDSL [Corchorus olitorius]